MWFLAGLDGMGAEGPYPIETTDVPVAGGPPSATVVPEIPQVGPTLATPGPVPATGGCPPCPARGVPWGWILAGAAGAVVLDSLFGSD